MKKTLKLFFIFIISLITIYTSFLIADPRTNIKNEDTIIKAKYIPSTNKIIRVEIVIYDDTVEAYNDINYVEFNNQTLDLSPALASGFRGRKYFQLEPGNYVIKWKVAKDKAIKWPNQETHQETIILKDYQPYVHILIKGDQLSIS